MLYGPSTFMIIIGNIEIIAGIIVFVRPLVGAYIVMAWLICIALQLVTSGPHYDVAVRDLIMGDRCLCFVSIDKDGN